MEYLTCIKEQIDWSRRIRTPIALQVLLIAPRREWNADQARYPIWGNYGVTEAQTVPATPEGPIASQQLVRDPVCGMEISTREAAASAEVGQNRYWFCSPHCEQAFLANPAKYIPHPVDNGSSSRPTSSATPPVGAPPTAAATPALASSAAKQLAKDPICGMMVDKATALSAERGNRKYYFCSESCLRTFESPESELKAMKTRVTIALTGVLALAVLRAGAFLALAAGATLLTWAPIPALPWFYVGNVAVLAGHAGAVHWWLELL